MIEVIKHGKLAEKHDATCPQCDCKFLFQREDVYWSRPLVEYIVMCPECGKEFGVGDIFD